MGVFERAERPALAVGAIAAGGLGALLLIAGLIGAFAFVGVGGTVLTSAAPAQVPAPALPVAPPPSAPLPIPACAITRPRIQMGSSISSFQFIGARPDGSEVALALGRQSDKRAQVIDYAAGSRRVVAEWVLSPGDVPDSWTDVVDVLKAVNKSGMARRGLEAGSVPASVAWCQAGNAVQIGEQAWNWQTVEESCGITTNTSFELCPPGVTDPAMCARPIRMSLGCSDVEPRLVDVFELGDAVWVVAERPGATTPRFAAGVMLGK